MNTEHMRIKEQKLCLEGDLCFDKLLKQHLKFLKRNENVGCVRPVIDRLQAAKPGCDLIFDNAWLIKSRENSAVLAVLWLIEDILDPDQLICRLLNFSRENLEVDHWNQIISWVHSNYQNSFSISWQLTCDQSLAQIVLHQYNYKWIGRINDMISLPDYDCSDGWMMRVDFNRRNDTGIAFVKFPYGYLAVRGNSNFIQSVSFVRFGKKPDNKAVLWTAGKLNLLDSGGKILSESTAKKDIYINFSARHNGYALPEAVQIAASQLQEYISGYRTGFDLPLQQSQGSDFQQKVWQAISSVPFASTATYEDLAEKIVQPGQKPSQLARAIGSACAANPLPVLIPCHRIIGKNGRLTGFNGGIDIKEYLLNHEMFGL